MLRDGVLGLTGATALADQAEGGNTVMARIVGEQTYGKGSVQTIIPLSDGRALKLTTSHYLTPSGRAINGTGIKPDYAVSAQNATQQYRGPGSDITPGDDTQLQEALRVIGHNSLELSRAP